MEEYWNNRLLIASCTIWLESSTQKQLFTCSIRWALIKNQNELDQELRQEMTITIRWLTVCTRQQILISVLTCWWWVEKLLKTFVHDSSLIFRVVTNGIGFYWQSIPQNRTAFWAWSEENREMWLKDTNCSYPSEWNSRNFSWIREICYFK